MIRFQYYPTVDEAFKMGWDKMTGYTTLTLKFFGRLLSGQASLQHVSGPLAIADVAGNPPHSVGSLMLNFWLW